MTRLEELVPIRILRECFEVDFALGILRWKRRPRGHFQTDREWKLTNTQLAGRVAGNVSLGYRETVIRRDGVRCRLRVHRIIWALAHGRWPVLTIDHKNGADKGDGLANLREATNGEQRQNEVRLPGKSGFRGVRPNGRGRFQAHIMVNRKFINLGQFGSAEEAHAAYLAAKKVHHPFNPVPRA